MLKAAGYCSSWLHKLQASELLVTMPKFGIMRDFFIVMFWTNTEHTDCVITERLVVLLKHLSMWKCEQKA